MTNIAKILTLAATLVVGTGAISGMALASSGIPAAYRVGNDVGETGASVSSSKVGSGIPAAYRIGSLADEASDSLFRSAGVGSGIPAPYRLGN
jgi:hypothetical protein